MANTIDSVSVIGVGSIARGGTIKVPPGYKCLLSATVSVTPNGWWELWLRLYQDQEEHCAGDGLDLETHYVAVTTSSIEYFLKGYEISALTNFRLYLSLNYCGWPYGYDDLYDFNIDVNGSVPAQGCEIVNDDFETSDFTGWSTDGDPTVGQEWDSGKYTANLYFVKW